MGEQLERHEDVLLEAVRGKETLPMEETKSFVVSLDGVNVRLNSPGKRAASPQRPSAPMIRESLPRSVFDKATKASQTWYRKMESLLLEHDDGVLRVIRSVEYYLNA